MTYEQALAFWYARIDYERASPKKADLTLERMRAILQALGNPHERYPIIHVAGSKGKGSTSAMLAAILTRAGYRTGLFTSPHLCRVEERVQIDGAPITPDELADVFTEIAAATGASGSAATGSASSADPRSATFFELGTALGFLHFARSDVDVAVVEVGLGGRFDSTNVCQPVVAVITSISFDHTQILGNRLDAIAMEKAGIIKPGAAAISGARAPEARAVLESICKERGVRLRQLEIDFRYRYQPGEVRNDMAAGNGVAVSSPLLTPARIQVRTEQRSWPEMELGLLGDHQAANAAVAVACVEELRVKGFQIGDEEVSAGLAGVRWPARLEVLSRRPIVVLDCAHNVASARALVDTLLASFPAGRRLLVFGASQDKDVHGILEVFAPHFAHAYFTHFTSNPRAVPAEQLPEMLDRAANLPFSVCPAPGEAWRAARANAGPEDIICITGSVYLAGELRSLLLSESPAAPAFAVKTHNP
jgi:dihydrofolate synthase/folylpolyglutamate synthase